MEYKCRNCNTCVYFPCTYYNQFNVDRNIGCINWSDKIVHTYVSSGTNCEKANLTVDTQYEKEKLPILKEENGKFYVAEEGINQYGEHYGYWLPISKELYLFLKNVGGEIIMNNKTLILPVYDGKYLESIYINNEQIYLKPGKPYFDIWEIYNNVALAKSFAYRVFEKYNELEHIIICDNGNMKIFHRDDFAKKEDENYIYYGTIYHHQLHLVNGKSFAFKTTFTKCDGHSISDKRHWNELYDICEEDKEYSDDFDSDNDIYFELTNNEKEMSNKTKSLLIKEAIKYYRGSCETHQMSILALEERVEDLKEMLELSAKQGKE